MTGTIAFPLPGFLARRLPVNGLRCFGVVLLPHSLAEEVREHTLMLRMMQIAMSAVQRVSPSAWRIARDITEQESLMLVEHSEMPGPSPIWQALDGLGLGDPQRCGGKG